ncbi:MAG: hypothetical protein JSV32_04995 [Dehalococcoidia bacterium]|nr:MAG: hypothetical protein JSV32_04995 [Dehalococcoidia bacterium]
MHFLVRNIKWGERGTVIDKDQKLPHSYLVKNAVSQAEALNTSIIHFDAEVDDAEVVFIADPNKVTTVEAVVNNG